MLNFGIGIFLLQKLIQQVQLDKILSIVNPKNVNEKCFLA